ncbi:hypothetical protein GGR58DRAFT_306947 [Xylaria digitata]|nr:hypothetical protein GGR58DRAFT_306947 [Xylaria digitata]
MSARIFQSAPRVLRQRQQVLVGSCLGLSVGTGLAIRSSPRVRFDNTPPTTSSFSTSLPAFSNTEDKNKGGLNPELMRQLSGGSVTGFLSGLIVSVFSQTLVLLLGLSVVILQILARYGIDIIDRLRLRQRVSKSRVLAALDKDPVFKLSFGLLFALSAFMQF